MFVKHWSTVPCNSMLCAVHQVWMLASMRAGIEGHRVLVEILLICISAAFWQGWSAEPTHVLPEGRSEPSFLGLLTRIQSRVSRQFEREWCNLALGRAAWPRSFALHYMFITFYCITAHAWLHKWHQQEMCMHVNFNVGVYVCVYARACVGVSRHRNSWRLPKYLDHIHLTSYPSRLCVHACCMQQVKVSLCTRTACTSRCAQVSVWYTWVLQ